MCNGYSWAAQKKGIFDCPFCRTPMTMNNATKLALIQKRVDAKDPVAIKFLGDKYFHGRYGLEKNVPRGIELLTEAAELGCIDAFFSLGIK